MQRTLNSRPLSKTYPIEPKFSLCRYLARHLRVTSAISSSLSPPTATRGPVRPEEPQRSAGRGQPTFRCVRSRVLDQNRPRGRCWRVRRNPPARRWTHGTCQTHPVTCPTFAILRGGPAEVLRRGRDAHPLAFPHVRSRPAEDDGDDKPDADDDDRDDDVRVAGLGRGYSGVGAGCRYW
ncbi:hypothetical protein BD414DRAFT_80404 [Trametes punicea]|nr:hypothetical protein BD414DRAFT_80404 [Trametes punicea]